MDAYERQSGGRVSRGLAAADSGDPRGKRVLSPGEESRPSRRGAPPRQHPHLPPARPTPPPPHRHRRGLLRSPPHHQPSILSTPSPPISLILISCVSPFPSRNEYAILVPFSHARF